MHNFPRRTLLAGAAGVSVAGLMGGHSAAANPTPGQSGPLTVTGHTVEGQVETVTMRTAALAQAPTVAVLLPHGYGTGNKRYPVIYLLHGASADHTQGIAVQQADFAAADQEVIVVMPDGGPAGWYSNPKQQAVPSNYETFHIDQLIPWIDQNYRTLGKDRSRGVVGSGMGGFGALKYAAKHPALFGAVASLSGFVSLRGNNGYLADVAEAHGATQNGIRNGLYGTPRDNAALSADNPVENVSRYRGMRVAIYDGVGDGLLRQDTAAQQGQQEFSDALTKAEVQHEFVRRSGPRGIPSWEALSREIDPMRASLA